MKRLMLLLAFLISVGTSAFGQLEKEVTLSSTTNLAAVLGDEVATVTTLKISGPLTLEDFSTMKNDMAMLQVLDMSGVTSLPLIKKSIINRDFIYSAIPSDALAGKLTLRQVIFPSCLELISSEAFAACENLSSVDLSKSNLLKIIAENAFFYCTSLKSLNLSEKKLLQSIERQSFYNCKDLSYLDLSGCENLGSIKAYSFSMCSSLKIVDMSNCSNIISIMNSAFAYCFNLNKVELSGCNSLSIINDCAFDGCTSLYDFDFSQLSALGTIGWRAFCGCEKLTTINCSNSAISEVKSSSFQDCNSLESVNFSGCYLLNKLDKNAFSSCVLLQEIIIDNDFYKSVDGVLYVVDMATLMFYPSGKKDAEFTIPNTVSTIQTRAFCGNNNLKEVKIPSTIKSIQENAFISFRGKTIRMLAESPIELSSDIGLRGATIYVPYGKLQAYKDAPIWQDYTLIEANDEGATANAALEGISKASRTFAVAGALHIEPLIEQPMEVWVVSAGGQVIAQQRLTQPIVLAVRPGLYFIVTQQRGERQVEKLRVE